MKISKQERIIIIFFIVAAIIGVGIFVFILPNYNNIAVNQKALDKKLEEFHELDDKLNAREPVIDKEIREAYEQGKNLADIFYTELTPVEADEISRMFLSKGKDLTIDGLAISSYATETLSVSVFKKAEPSYPLKDFANTSVSGGNKETDYSNLSKREKIMQAKQKTASSLSTSGTVTVGCMTVSFVAHSDKRENLHEFADLLNKGIYDEKIIGTDGKPQRKATYLDGAIFELNEQPTGTGSSNNNSNSEEGGENQEGNTGNNNNKKDFSMAFKVKYYCIKPVADPFGDAA